MNSKIKRCLCSLCAAVLFTSAGGYFSPDADTSVSSTLIKSEFEDGRVGGESVIYRETWKDVNEFNDTFDLTNASGGAFSHLGRKGTTVSVNITVPEPGLYELYVNYCQPFDRNRKVQYLNVNGSNQGEVAFFYNLKFEETPAGIVMLKEGSNTVEFEGYWGYTYFDYLTLKPAGGNIRNISPVRELSNPNATESAKRLYNYLCDTYGNNIISGQQEYCGSHNYNLWQDPDNYIKDNEAEFEYILNKTGKMPAIRGIDLIFSGYAGGFEDHAAERARQWVNEYGGIAALCWHWNVPSAPDGSGTEFYTKSSGNKYTTFSISKALTPGTWENEVLMKDIEIVAGKLKILADADAPVLWRPLHEAEGNGGANGEGAWFWWGAEGPEYCKQLYHLLYDQLTNVYGLNNLIWQWTGSTTPDSPKWYPGDDVVDMIGYDKYNAKDGLPNLSSIASTFYSLVQSTNGQKMVAMTENDTIPSLENLINDKAGWLYFCPWYMQYLQSEQNNPVNNLIEIYQSEYCITLDELPDLKSYPISSQQPTAATETVPNNPDILYGDANTDGKVDIGDVIKVRNHVLDPGNKESDPGYISLQGKLNANVAERETTGVNVTDALAIQRSLVGGKL